MIFNLKPFKPLSFILNKIFIKLEDCQTWIHLFLEIYEVEREDSIKLIKVMKSKSWVY